MAIAACPDLSLGERLAHLSPFADDPHFAVREWAWLSFRPTVAAELGGAIGVLRRWTAETSPNLRRFASEATRPRGVWSVHILALKQEPALGLPILSPLRADGSRYVQDSVANWLNDASKSRPQWVAEICANWAATGDPHTERICRRAMRTLARAASASGPGSLTPAPSGVVSR
jgi:3-methyladenine DNA glycosylase AlkC